MTAVIFDLGGTLMDLQSYQQIVVGSAHADS